jgi:cyclase
MRKRGLVKTVQFKDGKYVGDPINAVKIFNEKEVDELTLLDIDATAEGREPDYKQLRDVAIESRMPLCYGGGITTAKQASDIISLGFEKISISAAALQRPELIKEMAEEVGRQSVVVTLDVKKSLFAGDGYSIFTHNGKRKTNQKLNEFILKAEEYGAGEIVLNNINLDGMMTGYDLKLAGNVRSISKAPLTFIGGAGNVSDMEDLIQTVGICGVGVGSFFVFKGRLKAVLISYSKPERLAF